MSFDLHQLPIKAATLDELLSVNDLTQPGQKDSTDLAALRLAAWCRYAANGDWSLFSKRLKRDNFSLDQILPRLADCRLSPNAPQPEWYVDAGWTYQALTQEFGEVQHFFNDGIETHPFARLFYSLVRQAESKAIERITPEALALLNEPARVNIRNRLLKQLTDLYAPLLYGKLVARLKQQSPDGSLPLSTSQAGTVQFNNLLEELRTSGLALIFAEKPVLLRLTATITRQWIETTTRLVTRLHSDLGIIREAITQSDHNVKVQAIGVDLSDPHNFGHVVQVITFDDQTRIVYKPKDQRLDVAWHDLIMQLNASSPPIDLKPVKTIACHEYGWSAFIEHQSCESTSELERFYRRAGAWLALFHLFASTDMHVENILAHGDHPVPIDLEMILQAAVPKKDQERPETAASIQASQTVSNSVLTVGMLPSYVKNINNRVIDAGGLNPAKNIALAGAWKNVNTDAMRWMQVPRHSTETPNVPHVNGQYATLGDHLPALIEGFEQYSFFLLKQRDEIGITRLLNPFRRLPVRKAIRNTRFYHMLLQRLKDHHNMSDGATWSAQAEFLSRLADWDTDKDLLWPLQQAERIALVNLNVPHFVSPSDGDVVSAMTGHQTQTGAMTGIDRAAERFMHWSEEEIERQVEIIKVSTSFTSTSSRGKHGKYLFKRTFKHSTSVLDQTSLIDEVKSIANTIRQHATIKEKSAAWVGLDWLGDSEVGQLVTLGPDLYSGSSGIALFLAAHARYAKDSESRDLAIKALAGTRLQITLPSAPRWARGLGIGGAVGLGSVVYALTVISELLADPALLKDALTVSTLFSNELISADRSLDVIAGSAGGILGLLALYRKTQSDDVLAKAIACGEHLLRHPRTGEMGKRSWMIQGSNQSPLTGFSHGAAGFAYALSSLATLSHREEFEAAAQECIAYEDSHYDDAASNWADFRTSDETGLPSQWCHGAVGIGLARVASNRATMMCTDKSIRDINHSVKNTVTNWPQRVDTLCCGTLGAIEFLTEASDSLNQPDLGQLADQRLAQMIANRHENGEYAWNAGRTRYNLGLFRGLSGVGYTILRRLDPQLPNVLMWE